MTNDPKPHIIYGKLGNDELTSLIRVTSKGRKKTSAGQDLIEMRREAQRRREGRVARCARKNYTKEEMLERSEKSPNFKPGNFIAGMSPKQEKFCMEYIATGDSPTAD